MDNVVKYSVRGKLYNRKELAELTGTTYSSIQQQDKKGLLDRNKDYTEIIPIEFTEGYYIINETMLARYLHIRTETLVSLKEKGLSYIDIYNKYIDSKRYREKVFKELGVKTVGELKDKYSLSEGYLDDKTNSIQGLNNVLRMCNVSEPYHYEGVLVSSNDTEGTLYKKEKNKVIFAGRKGLDVFFEGVYSVSQEVVVDGVKYSSLSKFVGSFIKDSSFDKWKKKFYKYLKRYEGSFPRELILSSFKVAYNLYEKGKYAYLLSPADVIKYHKNEEKVLSDGVLIRSGFTVDCFLEFYYSYDVIFSQLKFKTYEEGVIYVEEGIVDGEYFIYVDKEFIGTKLVDLLKYYDVSYDKLLEVLFTEDDGLSSFSNRLEGVNARTIVNSKETDFYISGMYFTSVKKFLDRIGVTNLEILKWLNTSRDVMDLFFADKWTPKVASLYLPYSILNLAYEYKGKTYYLVEHDDGRLEYISNHDMFREVVSKVLVEEGVSVV